MRLDIADVGAAGKRHFQAGSGGRVLDRGEPRNELPVAGKQFAALLDQLRIGFKRSCEGFSIGGRRRLPPSLRAKRSNPSLHEKKE